MDKHRAHPASTAGQSKAAFTRGKRRGVNILSQEVLNPGGMEDRNEFFVSAQSRVTKKENRKKSIRFSLDNNNNINDTSTSNLKSNSNARKLIGKKTTRRSTMSPYSELLSRFFRVPPTDPATHPEQEDPEEQVEEKKLARHQLLGSPEASDEDEDDYDDDNWTPPPPADSQRVQVEAPTEIKVDFPAGQDFGDNDDDNDINFQEPPIQEEKKKAKKKSKKRKETTVEEIGEEPDTTTRSVPCKRKKKTKKLGRFQTARPPKGISAGPREFDQIPMSEGKEMTEEAENNFRRSKRARMKPLEFWNGEHIEWGAPNNFRGDNEYPGLHIMPLSTPYERRATRVEVVSHSERKKGEKTASEAMPEVTPFDSKELRKKYNYMIGEEAYMFEVGHKGPVIAKVVSYHANMVESNLPLSKYRTKSEGNVVGRAAQAFNIAGYVMGNLTLPPQGIKDPESAGPCAKTFTVVSCQPNAVEVAFSDPKGVKGVFDHGTAQRFLLGPGDLFHVMPNSDYRIQNHSQHTECFMTWTIIRPAPSPQVNSPQSSSVPDMSSG